MQPQYSQGAAPSHQPLAFAPPEVPQPNGSVTSSLRQWRKKDYVDKQQAPEQPPTSAAENPSHVARVAPHTYYPRLPNDVCHFQQQYTEYGVPFKSAPVKYSEIVDSPQQPVDGLKLKEKEFGEFQHALSPMKQSYPEGVNPAVHQSHLHPFLQKQQMQYIQKEPYQQFMPKYGMQGQYQAYSEPNNFLARLNKINPQMAQSIINDTHLREPQMHPTMYHTLEQNRAYPQQRMYHASIPSAPPNRSMQGYNYPQPYNYNLKNNMQPNDPYNRVHQYQQVPRFPEYKMNAMEQPIPNISPQRMYNEGMHMNYAPMPPKISPNYPHCSQQLEYAQHYQHRRNHLAQEYYPQAYKPPYAQHPETSPETQESRTRKSSLKQYLETWVEEDMAGNLPDLVMSNNLSEENMEGLKAICMKNQEQQLYVLDSTEIPNENLPHFLHLQQVEKLPDNIRGYYQSANSVANRRIIIENNHEDAIRHMYESQEMQHRKMMEAFPVVERSEENKVVQIHIIEEEGHSQPPSDRIIIHSNVPVPAEESCIKRGVIEENPEPKDIKNMPVIDEEVTARAAIAAKPDALALPPEEPAISRRPSLSSIFKEMEHIHREPEAEKPPKDEEVNHTVILSTKTQTPADLNLNQDDKGKEAPLTDEEPDPLKEDVEELLKEGLGEKAIVDCVTLEEDLVEEAIFEPDCPEESEETFLPVEEKHESIEESVCENSTNLEKEEALNLENKPEGSKNEGDSEAEENEEAAECIIEVASPSRPLNLSLEKKIENNAPEEEKKKSQNVEEKYVVETDENHVVKKDEKRMVQEEHHTVEEQENRTVEKEENRMVEKEENRMAEKEENCTVKKEANRTTEKQENCMVEKEENRTVVKEEARMVEEEEENHTTEDEKLPEVNEHESITDLPKGVLQNNGRDKEIKEETIREDHPMEEQDPFPVKQESRVPEPATFETLPALETFNEDANSNAAPEIPMERSDSELSESSEKTMPVLECMVEEPPPEAKTNRRFSRTPRRLVHKLKVSRLIQNGHKKFGLKTRLRNKPKRPRRKQRVESAPLDSNQEEKVENFEPECSKLDENENAEIVNFNEDKNEEEEEVVATDEGVVAANEDDEVVAASEEVVEESEVIEEVEDFVNQREEALRQDEDAVPSDEAVVEREEVVAHNEDVVTQNEDVVTQNEDMVIQNEETVAQNEETVAQNEEAVIQNKEMVAQNEETVIQSEEMVSRSEMLHQSEEMLDQNAKLVNQNEETVAQNEEPVIQSEEMVSRNEILRQSEEILDQNAEMVNQNEETVAQNEEPVMQSEETVRRTEMLHQSEEMLDQNPERVNQNEEIVIQNEETVAQNEEPVMQSEEMISRNEMLRQSEEILDQNVKMMNQNEETVIQNEGTVMQSEEMVSRNKMLHQSEEMLDQNDKMVSQNEEIVIQNEMIVKNEETVMQCAEMVSRNEEMVDQSEEMLDQNEKMPNQNEEMVIQNEEMVNRTEEILHQNEAPQNEGMACQEEDILGHENAVDQNEEDVDQNEESVDQNETVAVKNKAREPSIQHENIADQNEETLNQNEELMDPDEETLDQTEKIAAREVTDQEKTKETEEQLEATHHFRENNEILENPVIYQIEHSNVLLQIADELLEITVAYQNGKKTILVKTFSDAAVMQLASVGEESKIEAACEEPLLINNYLELCDTPELSFGEEITVADDVYVFNEEVVSSSTELDDAEKAEAAEDKEKKRRPRKEKRVSWEDECLNQAAEQPFKKCPKTKAALKYVPKEKKEPKGPVPCKVEKKKPQPKKPEKKKVEKKEAKNGERFFLSKEPQLKNSKPPHSKKKNDKMKETGKKAAERPRNPKKKPAKEAKPEKAEEAKAPVEEKQISVQENSITSSTCQESEIKERNTTIIQQISEEWDDDEDVKESPGKRRLSLQEYNSRKRTVSQKNPSPQQDDHQSPSPQQYDQKRLSPQQDDQKNLSAQQYDQKRLSPQQDAQKSPSAQKTPSQDDLQKPDLTDNLFSALEVHKRDPSPDSPILCVKFSNKTYSRGPALPKRELPSEENLSGAIELNLPKKPRPIYQKEYFKNALEHDLHCVGSFTTALVKKHQQVMHRFMAQQRLTGDELKTVKHIIRYKRLFQHLQNIRNNEMQGIEVRQDTDLLYPARPLVVEAKQKKKRFRFLYSDEEEPAEKKPRLASPVVGYSVHQSNTQGQLTLVFKRSFKSDPRMQPFVKLERLTSIDFLAKTNY